MSECVGGHRSLRARARKRERWPCISPIAHIGIASPVSAYAGVRFLWTARHARAAAQRGDALLAPQPLEVPAEPGVYVIYDGAEVIYVPFGQLQPEVSPP